MRIPRVSPTSLHQLPVGRGATDQEKDEEKQQRQADAHDGSGRCSGGKRLRILAWEEHGCHRMCPAGGWCRRGSTHPPARSPNPT